MGFTSKLLQLVMMMISGGVDCDGDGVDDDGDIYIMVKCLSVCHEK